MSSVENMSLANVENAAASRHKTTVHCGSWRRAFLQVGKCNCL